MKEKTLKNEYIDILKVLVINEINYYNEMEDKTKIEEQYIIQLQNILYILNN